MQYTKPDKKVGSATNPNTVNGLEKQNIALSKTIQQLQKNLASKATASPNQEDEGSNNNYNKSEADARLEKLRTAKAAMVAAGIEAPDLDQQLTQAVAAVEQLKARPDLRTVMGKLKAADSHKQQCAEAFVKAQDLLEAARLKLVKAESAKIELEREKNILLAAEVQQSSIQGTTVLALPPAPGHLTLEQQSTWEASILQIKEQQQAAMQQVQAQVNMLMATFAPLPAAVPAAGPPAPVQTGSGTAATAPIPVAKRVKVAGEMGEDDPDDMEDGDGGGTGSGGLPGATVCDPALAAEAEAAAQRSAELCREAAALNRAKHYKIKHKEAP
jgi:hypothetical protein